MATKSILKNIDIKDKNMCRLLVNALENAQEKKSVEVKMSKPVWEVKRDDIKKIFGSSK